VQTLSHQQLLVLFLSLGVLLGTARLLGELAQKLHQPAVLGELLAGVVLGPTILGMIAPQWSAFVFPATGTNAIALEAISNVAIVLFLMVAGLEVDLSTVWRQGKTGLKVGLTSIVVPFIFGFAVAWFVPQWMGRHVEADALTFALFFATALSISALPVIAKTLMDLDLYRSDMGMVVVSAAIFNDIIGWIIFAIVLGMMGAGATDGGAILNTIALTLGFTAFMFTIGRWAIDKILPILQIYTKWPGGVLGFSMTLAFLGAAFTEWIGIHAIFGSFLVGVAMGDSSQLREHTRVTIDHFVSYIFAPIFFASIGLKVNFFANFDLLLVVTVVAIATICKLAGGMWGARWGGMSKNESWSVGFAMNSRGAMEIILGMLALEAGIIQPPLFVALVIMAIFTSMISGPFIKFFLRSKDQSLLHSVLQPDLFIPHLQSLTRTGVIGEMSEYLATKQDLNIKQVENAVLKREELLSTGIGNGVAIPHARVPFIQETKIVVGISSTGIDFDSPDGNKAHVLFLMLTPADKVSEQLELGAEIAKLFRDPNLAENVSSCKTLHSFLSRLKKGK
jgi:Kef-type K+ transport system membrane component KefB/mannitol/fructose-specific phosphotransferase system IIA component (Ntr-type)